MPEWTKGHVWKTCDVVMHPWVRIPSSPPILIMTEESHRFFQNKGCEYFPCKKGVDVNCLLCYCPLYHYKDCGGNYKLTEKGIKDCSECKLPHRAKGYDYIIGFLKKECDRRSR